MTLDPRFVLDGYLAIGTLAAILLLWEW